MTKREQVESYIYDLMDDLDPSGKNTERYKKLFKSMSQKAFDEYMHHLRDGKVQFFVYISNITTKVTMDQLFKVARKRKIDIFQKIRFRDPATDRPYLTKYPMMVLNLPVRRLSQYLFHKISLPESDGKINPTTGQVIPPDKGAALSLVETQILAAKGLETSTVELLKVRGGDMDAYQSFKRQIEENGEAKLSEVPMTNRPRSAVTAQMYLHAMQLDSNL